MTVNRSSAASAVPWATLGDCYPVDRPAHGRADHLLIGPAPPRAWPGNVRSALSRPARLRPENIGFVLTLSGIAGLLAQYSGGELLDAVRSKRLVLLGAHCRRVQRAVIGLWPRFAVVLFALVLQGTTCGVVGPAAIPAVSLGLQLASIPSVRSPTGLWSRFLTSDAAALVGRSPQMIASSRCANVHTALRRHKDVVRGCSSGVPGSFFKLGHSASTAAMVAAQSGFRRKACEHG